MSTLFYKTAEDGSSKPGLWGVADLETHALEESRIVQIGAAFFRGIDHLETKVALVNPGCPISAGAQKIHGISDAMVADKPLFTGIAEEWFGALRTGCSLFMVTFNGRRYDTGLLQKHFAEAGAVLDISDNLIDGYGTGAAGRSGPSVTEEEGALKPWLRIVHLDVFDFVKWKLRHTKGLKLEELCQRYGVKLDGAHDAGADARATGELFMLLVAEGTIPASLDQALTEARRFGPLLDAEYEQFKFYLYRREDGVLRIGYSEQHIGTPLDQVDRGFLSWALRNENKPNRDPKFKMPELVKEIFKAQLAGREPPVPMRIGEVSQAEPFAHVLGPKSKQDPIEVDATFTKPTLEPQTSPPTSSINDMEEAAAFALKREPLHIGPVARLEREHFTPAALPKLPKTAAALYAFFGEAQRPFCLIELERDIDGAGKIVVLVPQGNSAAQLQSLANELWSHLIKTVGLDARGEWSRNPNDLFVEVQQYASGQPEDHSIVACIANQPPPRNSYVAPGGAVPAEPPPLAAIKIDRRAEKLELLMPFFSRGILPELPKTAAWLEDAMRAVGMPFVLLGVERSTGGIGVITIGIDPEMMIPEPDIKMVAHDLRAAWRDQGHSLSAGEWSPREGSLIIEVCRPDPSRKDGWRSSHEARIKVDLSAVEVARAPYQWSMFEHVHGSSQEIIAEQFPETFAFMQGAMQHHGISTWLISSLVRNAKGLGRLVVDLDLVDPPRKGEALKGIADDLRERAHFMLIYRDGSNEWAHSPDSLTIGLRQPLPDGFFDTYDGGTALPPLAVDSIDFAKLDEMLARERTRAVDPCHNCTNRVESLARTANHLRHLGANNHIEPLTQEENPTPRPECRRHSESVRECDVFRPLSESWFHEKQPAIGWVELRSASGKVAMFMPEDCADEQLATAQLWALSLESVPGIECVEVHKQMSPIARTWNLGTVPTTGALLGGKLKRYFWTAGNNRMNVKCEIVREVDGTGTLYIEIDYAAPQGLLNLIVDSLFELLNEKPSPAEWNVILGRPPINVQVCAKTDTGGEIYVNHGTVGPAPGAEDGMLLPGDLEASTGQLRLEPRELKPGEMLQEGKLPEGLRARPYSELTLLPMGKPLHGNSLRLHVVRSALALLASMVRSGEDFTDKSEEHLAAARTAIGEMQVLSENFDLVIEERLRQMSVEGWTPEHDAEHVDGELAWAAACYTAPEQILRKYGEMARDAWPWHERFDKRMKHSRKRCLIIGAALILAELDRIDCAHEMFMVRHTEHSPVLRAAIVYAASPESAVKLTAEALGIDAAQLHSPKMRDLMQAGVTFGELRVSVLDMHRSAMKQRLSERVVWASDGMVAAGTKPFTQPTFVMDTLPPVEEAKAHRLVCSACGRTTEAAKLRGEKCAAPVKDDSIGYCPGTMQSVFVAGEVVKRLADGLLMTVEAAAGISQHEGLVPCVWADFPSGSPQRGDFSPDAIEWASLEEIEAGMLKWAQKRQHGEVPLQVFRVNTAQGDKLLGYVLARGPEVAHLLPDVPPPVNVMVTPISNEALDHIAVSIEMKGAQQPVTLAELRRLHEQQGGGEALLWRA